MYKRLVFGVSSLLVMMMLSCQTLLSPKVILTPEPTVVPPPNATPTEVQGPANSTPPPTPSTPTFTLVLENASPYPICEVYIASVETEDWGDNWLIGRIEPGASYRFDVPEGKVDVEVWTCDGAVLATFWELDTGATLKAGTTDMETLHLINSLGDEICRVYIANVESPDWGDSWLPSYEVIEIGIERLFFLPQGLYDVMVEDCEGTILAQVTLPVLSGGVIWEAGAQVGPGDKYIYLYNRSDYTICGLYFGPPESEFGPNLVGSDALIEFSPLIWAVEVGLEHPWVVAVEDCDGLRLDYNPKVYPGSWVVIGGEGRVPLEVYNYTTFPICEIYISLATDGNWGDNRLMEGEVLNPQVGTRVFFIEPNTYDLLAVGCDGETVAEYRGGTIEQSGATWKLNP